MNVSRKQDQASSLLSHIVLLELFLQYFQITQHATVQTVKCQHGIQMQGKMRTYFVFKDRNILNV